VGFAAEQADAAGEFLLAQHVGGLRAAMPGADDENIKNGCGLQHFFSNRLRRVFHAKAGPVKALETRISDTRSVSLQKISGEPDG